MTGTTDLVELARRHGIGEVVRLHRRRAPLPEPTAGWAGGALVCAVLFLATQSRWLGITLVVLAGAGALAAYRVWADPPERRGPRFPRRIAVCAGGLVIDAGGAPARAVPWSDVMGDGPVLRAPLEVVHEVRLRSAAPGPGAAPSAGAAGPDVIEIGPYTSRAALVRSIAARRPAPASPWPGMAVAVAAAAVVGLFVWRAVLPDYVTRTVDGRPGEGVALSAACAPPGTAFAGAPPFEGPGPHPVAVVPARQAFPAPDAAQLVACIEPDGDAGLADRRCSYSTSNMGIGGQVEVRSLRRGWYRITVYELRTHRQVGSERVIGEDAQCPEIKLQGTEVRTGVGDDQLRDVLDGIAGS